MTKSANDNMMTRSD